MAGATLFMSPVDGVAFRLPSAARVDVDDGVATGYPIEGIGRLEVRVFRIPLEFDAPFLEEISVLERSMLAIRTPRDECRDFLLTLGSRDVDVYFLAVAHRHGKIVLDDHSLSSVAL